MKILREQMVDRVKVLMKHTKRVEFNSESFNELHLQIHEAELFIDMIDKRTKNSGWGTK